MSAANASSFGGFLKGVAIGHVTGRIDGGIGNELRKHMRQEFAQGAGQLLSGGIAAKAHGGKFIDGVKGEAKGIGIVSGENKIAGWVNGVGEAKATNKATKAQRGPQPEISSTTDKQGNITYTRGKGTVVVNNGVTVKDTKNGNTIADVLTVSEKIGKTVYIISGHRTGSAASEHYRVAVDLYVPGQTSATTPTLRDTIHNMGIFNRVASYHNKNTVHVDYKSTGNQGRFHDGGKGWVHIP